MAKLLFRPPHLLRRHPAEPGVQRRPHRAQRSWSWVGGALPPPCGWVIDPAGVGDELLHRRPWRQQALREGLLVGLLTTLLTSSVLAAPDVFRQSPATTLAQLAMPGLVGAQPSSPGVWLECP